VKRAAWGWLTILGAIVGLFVGLAIAPELPAWVPWVLAVGVAAAFAATFVRKRRSH